MLLVKVLTNIHTFTGIDYSPKVLIAALTGLLLLYEVPFVGRRFVQLLDLAVTLL